MRRIVAAIGSEGQVTEAIAKASAETSVASEPTRRSRPNVTGVELLSEMADHVIGPNGKHYVAQIYGGVKPDGMWAGWIEFLDTQTAETLRTGQETTQGSREDLRYWASGLGPAFFEGAFARAR
jgi:hypothetical protein